MNNKELEKEIKKEYLKQFGERLRSIRKQKGFNSYEFYSYFIGLNRAQYGRYEKGQNMNLDTFFYLMYLLELDPVEFFSEGFDWKKLSKNKEDTP